MGRVIAIDYGKKRTGLAWTDPDQLIATGIGSFDTPSVKGRLKELMARETVVKVVLGYPLRTDGRDTHATEAVRTFESWLKRQFPGLPVLRWDERFTSKMAMQAMIDAGVKKKRRADKHLINEVSATLILQDYLRTSS